MKKLKVLLAAMLMTTALSGPLVTQASATPRSHSSHHSTHKRNSRPKTVHVRSYKKKNGTVVKAHDRATPQPK
jgi:hypothetical protein